MLIYEAEKLWKKAWARNQPEEKKQTKNGK